MNLYELLKLIEMGWVVKRWVSYVIFYVISAGAWIQHGFIDGVRNAGQVFINSVQFTIELEK